jgi:very-short-patch-repair endonuclease
MSRTQRRDPLTVALARSLRANGTAAERRLWSVLRGRALGGFRFRRQHPFGPYIVDFFCCSARLAIEIDGSQHWRSPQMRIDTQRDEYLRERGVRVLRFSNSEVLSQTEGVVETILRALCEPTRPSP